ncbi:hypothetical protein GS399_05150 [Pedobacter sp. HMF7647]|uniref:Uncharacterized protein n=1 Tax=Hufsiella arboris TaxID=2695275 RepID=A0A7K1Y7H6_9SPHI|nr:hypothetical protein [Hufsiella arboris]MXV50351.1 hypothetical protein [Hufsiella arboris]
MDAATITFSTDRTMLPISIKKFVATTSTLKSQTGLWRLFSFDVSGKFCSLNMAQRENFSVFQKEQRVELVALYKLNGDVSLLNEGRADVDR